MRPHNYQTTVQQGSFSSESPTFRVPILHFVTMADFIRRGAYLLEHRYTRVCEIPFSPSRPLGRSLGTNYTAPLLIDIESECWMIESERYLFPRPTPRLALMLSMSSWRNKQKKRHQLHITHFLEMLSITELETQLDNKKLTSASHANAQVEGGNEG